MPSGVSVRQSVVLEKHSHPEEAAGNKFRQELGEDFQEAVQGDLGIGCRVRKLESKSGTSFTMEAADFMEEFYNYERRVTGLTL